MSTDVLEEGMDITTCNLVIRFDPIVVFRSYVQSKGRARAKPSKFIVLVQSNNESQWIHELKEFKKIEEKQIDECHDGNDFMEEDDDSESDIEEIYFANPNDKINSPRITGLTGISILSSYVQTLPSDRFTKLTPFYDFEKKVCNPRSQLMAGLGFDGHGGTTCTLYMPHLTPYQEPFIGDSRNSRKRAKRAVALQVQ